MKARKKQAESSDPWSPQESDVTFSRTGKKKKAEAKSKDAGPLPGTLRETKLSRRGFLKTTAAGVVVVGAAAGALATTDLLQVSSSTTSQTQSSAPSQPALWNNITINLNGAATSLKVKANWSLSKVLRESLGLTGTKIGCDNSSCGACTVLMDGNPIYSCHRLAMEVNGHSITTIEGIGTAASLHPVQKAFINYGAYQCGYCTPGFIMSTVALLKSNPNPSEDDVLKALQGNICRCGSWVHIMQAVTGGKSE